MRWSIVLLFLLLPSCAPSESPNSGNQPLSQAGPTTSATAPASREISKVELVGFAPLTGEGGDTIAHMITLRLPMSVGGWNTSERLAKLEMRASLSDSAMWSMGTIYLVIDKHAYLSGGRWPIRQAIDEDSTKLLLNPLPFTQYEVTFVIPVQVTLTEKEIRIVEHWSEGTKATDLWTQKPSAIFRVSERELAARRESLKCLHLVTLEHQSTVAGEHKNQVEVRLGMNRPVRLTKVRIGPIESTAWPMGFSKTRVVKNGPFTNMQRYSAHFPATVKTDDALSLGLYGIDAWIRCETLKNNPASPPK